MTQPRTQPARPIRLSGGEILIDVATVPIVAALIEIALQARPDLWTGRDPAGIERVSRLRALTLAAFADTFENENAKAVTDEVPAHSHMRLMSAQEAAVELNVTPQRVGQLCASGQLHAEQDAPGCPWRIDPHSVTSYREDHRAA